MSTKNTYKLSLLLGIATLLFGLLMLFILPQKAALSPGFQTPIIAFEFARSQQDLVFLTGNGSTEKTNRQKMLIGHRWDMVFPFIYAGFIISLLRQDFIRGHLWARPGIWLAVVAILADLMENRILLQILSALEQDQPVLVDFTDLYLSTWLKWGCLVLSIFIHSIVLLRSRKIFWSLPGIFLFAIATLCLLLNSPPILTEIMSFFVSIFFLMSTIRIFLHIRQGRKNSS